jgi:hypothetical protein
LVLAHLPEVNPPMTGGDRLKYFMAITPSPGCTTGLPAPVR